MNLAVMSCSLRAKVKYLQKNKYNGVHTAHIQAAEEVIWAYDLDFHQRFFGTQFLQRN